jgi:uncharacterized protein YqgV (UPF0045/DUF77 family)
MRVSAQISVYPLRQKQLRPAIDVVRAVMEAHGLQPETGRVSTLVTGEADSIFGALGDGFVRTGAKGQVAMTITASNSCPG